MLHIHNNTLVTVTVHCLIALDMLDKRMNDFLQNIHHWLDTGKNEYFGILF